MSNVNNTVSIDFLKDLSQVTDLNQLEIKKNDVLVKRNALSTLFQNFLDVFRGLSESGRIEIALRNQKVFDVMQSYMENAMKSSSLKHRESVSTIQALQRTLNTLRLDSMVHTFHNSSDYANLPNNSKQYFDGFITSFRNKLISNEYGDLSDVSIKDITSTMETLKDLFVTKQVVKKPELITYLNEFLLSNDFVKLPAQSKTLLTTSIYTFVDNEREENTVFNEMRTKLNYLKNCFLTGTPKDLDLQLLANTFKTSLSNTYTQQLIHNFINDGIHDDFAIDMLKHSVKSYNSQLVESNFKDKDKAKNYHLEKLKELMGENCSRLLPFVTTALTQGGVAAVKAFLFYENNFINVSPFSFVQIDSKPWTDVKKSDDTLHITHTFIQGFNHTDLADDNSTAGLFAKVQVTLSINLKEGQKMQVEGKKDIFNIKKTLTTYMPTFSVTFNTLELSTSQPSLEGIDRD